MCLPVRSSLSVLAAVALLVTTAGWASEPTRRDPLAFSPESRVSLEGSSTLHPFSAQTHRLSGWVERAEGASATLEQQLGTGAISRVEIRIPVDSLTSNESLLDANLRQAMDAPRFPELVFRAEALQLDPSNRRLQAKGTLTIHGTERPWVLTAQVLSSTDGQLRLVGSTRLRMSEFGVTPPVFMHVMRTADEVEIHFALTVGVAARPQAQGRTHVLHRSVVRRAAAARLVAG